MVAVESPQMGNFAAPSPLARRPGRQGWGSRVVQISELSTIQTIQTLPRFHTRLRYYARVPETTKQSPLRTTALTVAGYSLAVVALAFVVFCAGVWFVAPVDWQTRWIVTAVCVGACSISVWLSGRCFDVEDKPGAEHTVLADKRLR